MSEDLETPVVSPGIVLHEWDKSVKMPRQRFAAFEKENY